jgi:phosphoglycolate phosphatase-like HAD superfamily hydrolase
VQDARGGGAEHRRCGVADELAARKFKAVLFDLDGTLVDIHGPLYIAARNALRDLGHEPNLTREAYHAALKSEDPFLGVPEENRPEYLKLAFAYFMAEVDRTERLEVLPHVPETLAELKRRGYTTGVVTSRPGDPQLLVEKLAMVGLASHLDHVVTQMTSSVKQLLDKTESLRQTATRAAGHPRACVYVGDEPRDIMAALQAGCGAAIAVATGSAPWQRLAHHPDYKPDRVMLSMAKLLDVIESLAREGESA